MANALHRCGATPVLLTEDNETAAGSIAVQLHIGEVRANCLPEDKLKAIGAFQRSGRPVCMIGDSTNDAPALKKAAVGIAMGSVGSNIAVDAADIALAVSYTHLDVYKRQRRYKIKISRRAIRNLFWLPGNP